MGITRIITVLGLKRGVAIGCDTVPGLQPIARKLNLRTDGVAILRFGHLRSGHGEASGKGTNHSTTEPLRFGMCFTKRRTLTL
jgi:hypothetical protein